MLEEGVSSLRRVMRLTANGPKGLASTRKALAAVESWPKFIPDVNVKNESDISNIDSERNRTTESDNAERYEAQSGA